MSEKPGYEKLKRDLEVLKNSDQMKQDILDASIDMIMRYDTNLEIVWANKTAAAMINQTVDALVGRKCHSVFQDRDAPCIGCPCLKAMRSGNVEHTVMYQPAMKKMGATYWDNYAVPVKDKNGHITGITEIARNVTAQKQAEQQLHLFRSIVEFSKEAIVVRDLKGRLVYINPAHQKLFGRPLEKARQINYQDHFLPESIEILNNVVLPGIREGRSWEGILEAIDKKGRRFPLWERTGTIPDENGKAIYGLGFMHDDTQRIRIENALRESEERYRSIFSQSPIAIELYDENGVLVDANQACLKLFGVMSIQDIQGFNLFDDPNLPDQQKEILKSGRTVCYQAAFDFAKVREHTLYETTQNGMMWLDVLATPVGEPFHGYLLQIQDITDRKSAETALEESEARWQFALEGAGSGVWDWDVETHKVFFSTRWKTMLGYVESDVGDTLDEWESRVHPDDLPAVRADIDAHFCGKTCRYKNEHRVRCKDGSYKWILDRGKIVERTEDGRPKRIIGTHSDISERKAAETEREKLISELKNALDQVKKLSGLLPICSICKKIRDDEGYWNQIESYIQEHSEARFSHSICRDCARKYYSDYDIFDDQE